MFLLNWFLLQICLIKSRVCTRVISMLLPESHRHIWIQISFVLFGRIQCNRMKQNKTKQKTVDQCEISDWNRSTLRSSDTLHHFFLVVWCGHREWVRTLQLTNSRLHEPYTEYKNMLPIQWAFGRLSIAFVCEPTTPAATTKPFT